MNYREMTSLDEQISHQVLSWKHILQAAKDVGFDACGIASAGRLDDDAVFMERWIAQGLHGNLSYLERNTEKRYDIRQLVQGAQWVIVVLLHYNKCGHDYHRTIKSLLYQLEAQLGNIPLPTQHIFCDSAPVLERKWAVMAGLGFIGRNRQFIHPQLGSLVHLGELVVGCEVTDIDTSTAPEIQAGCGDCRICIDRCIRGALGLDVWDARKCLAYETHKCTVCQQVCPYNQKSEQTPLNTNKI
ncbi:MAG: hypothetical protein J6T32_01340 [Paludibacteraceae bacterium]|nr:hypothetical protein [Paludibacteraceae bacterium]